MTQKSSPITNQFIQGDLQAIFDALYSIGAIEPILKMDWSQVNEEMQKHFTLLSAAISVVNSCGNDPKKLTQELHHLDSRSINFLAVEVAREFAEFQDRKELH